jgi:hypothetical protein
MRGQGMIFPAKKRISLNIKQQNIYFIREKALK